MATSAEHREIGESSTRVRHHRDAGSLLSRAGEWLLRHEAENNLPLSVLRHLANGHLKHGSSAYLATIEAAEGRILGCAIRTPPHDLLLTRSGPTAVDAIAADLATIDPTLPSVLGPEEDALRFAEQWKLRTGRDHQVAIRLGLFLLDAVRPPTAAAPGGLRVAQVEDARLVTKWMEEFTSEVGRPKRPTPQTIHERISREEIFLWDSGGEPRTTAGISGTSPNGARVGYVYTPPALRRRGYASSIVAALSQRILDGGWRFCVLFADQANPTAQRIYGAIGYERIDEVVGIRFDGAWPPRERGGPESAPA